MVYRICLKQPVKTTCWHQVVVLPFCCSSRCVERGIPIDKLQDRTRAEAMLQEFDRLEQLQLADLVGLYKSCGFPYVGDLDPDTLVKNLKEHLVECWVVAFSSQNEANRSKIKPASGFDMLVPVVFAFIFMWVMKPKVCTANASVFQMIWP